MRPPLWSAELTAWGTLAVAVVAAAVAIWSDFRISKRLREEREAADRRLAAERERHDAEIAEERRLASERLRAEQEHSEAQFRT